MIADTINLLDDRAAFLSYLLHEMCKGCHPALRSFLGDERFAAFVDRFSGTYFKMPATRKLDFILDRYRLAEKYRLYTKAYKEGRLSDGRALEADFKRIAHRLRLSPERAIKHAQETLKAVKAAKDWEAQFSAAMAKAERSMTEKLDNEVGDPLPTVTRPAHHAARQVAKVKPE